MYTYSGQNIEVKCYDVYLRKHAITGTGNWNSLPSLSPWTQSDFNRDDTPSVTELTHYKDGLADDGSAAANSFDTDNDACWVKIGVLESEPSLVTSEGTKIPLATCNDKVIGKKVEIDFTSLSVNGDNWDEMLDLEDSGPVDVLFVVTNEVTDSDTTTKNGKGAANLQLDVNLNIKGNDIDRMPFKLSKEVGNIRKFVNFFNVNSAT